MRFAIAALLLLLCFGCIKPENRSLKRPDPPQLEAGWGNWERPGFSLAAPDSWSPYLSREALPPRQPEPGQEPSTSTQWTITDKEGDEAHIESLAKQGIQLRLYDNATRSHSGVVEQYLSVRVEQAEGGLQQEAERFKKKLGQTLVSEKKIDLPVGTAYRYGVRDQGMAMITYLLIDDASRYLVEIHTPDEALAQSIMQTFRVR